MQLYTWDRQGFQTAYWKSYYKQLGCGAVKARNCSCAERDLTYSRQFFEQDDLFKVRAQNLINNLQLQESADILVIGCGLGFLMEELKVLGMNVWGVDNSQYIQSMKNKEKVLVPIYNISATSDSFVNSVRNAAGAMWFDVVVTEDMLTSHDSYDVIFSNCEQILNPSSPKTNIVHIVDTNASAPFASKTLDQWKQLKPDHLWLTMLGNLQ